MSSNQNNSSLHVEESTGTDGVHRTTYTSNGQILFYQHFSPGGLPIIERDYDSKGEILETRIYNPNGVLQERALQTEHGLERSKWLPDGRPLEVGTYVDNWRHGLFTLYSSQTGAVLSRIEYQKDKRHGLSEEYYDLIGHETLKERALYSEGQLEGEFQRYFENGQLEESGRIESRRFQGPRLRYFKNGQLQSTQNYFHGNLHGVSEEYYDNGQLSRRQYFENGVRHGIEESFNRQGLLTKKTAWIKGQASKDFAYFSKEGPQVVEIFNQQGKLVAKHTYQNGVLEGPFETHYQDGSVRESGQYLLGRLHGAITQFRLTGAKWKIKNFDRGILHGSQTLYFESGEIQQVEEYEMNSLLSVREYFENGELKEISEYSEDGSGKLTRYTDRGILVFESQFRTNPSRSRQWRHGIERVYSPEGILLEDSEYQSNRRHGKFKQYTRQGVLQFEKEYIDGILRRMLVFSDGKHVSKSITYHNDGSIRFEENLDELSTQEKALNSSPDRQLEKGTVIGPYKIIRTLGHGGMGDVYLAFEKDLDRKVAVKLIRGEVDEHAKQRFFSEGKSLARIQHQNIVTIYTLGSHQEMPYMAMEYIEGWPLKTLLGQGLLGFNEQLHIFRQLLDGMQAAHEATVLHRDLKPANVIIGKNLQVKIIDFGISKILMADDGEITKPKSIVGTVKYMAPESLRGLPATLQTDIFSLGVVMFEILTGEVPFRGEDKFAVIEKIKNDPIEFPEGIRDILPQGLKDLITRMTAKSVSDRPTTMQEVRRQLDQISFDHLPEEFKFSVNPSPEIANTGEIRKQLLEQGHSNSELSLILNLASRIQQNMTSSTADETQNISIPQELVISPEALNRAAERYQQAKERCRSGS